MGRPTNEKKERVVKLRISEDMYEELAREGSNLSETIRGIIRKQGKSFVPQNCYVLEGGVYTELKSMENFVGGSMDRMMELYLEALMDGTVTYEGGKLVGRPEYDLDGLEEACHERGISVQEAVDKMVKQIRSGK